MSRENENKQLLLQNFVVWVIVWERRKKESTVWMTLCITQVLGESISTFKHLQCFLLVFDQNSHRLVESVCNRKRMHSKSALVRLNSNWNIAPKIKRMTWHQFVNGIELASNTYVSICSISIFNRTIFRHRYNCNTQINSQWIHIEESEKC